MPDRPLTERELELEEERRRIRKFGNEVARTKESARAFLVRAGIVTPKGNLRKSYR